MPVVMEAECADTREWHGAVGMRLGGSLYIDLSSDGEQLEQGVKALLARVQSLCDGLPAKRISSQ